MEIIPTGKPPRQGGMQFHPAAGILPLLEESDLESLTDDIRKHGLREPIKTYEGKILDGRHRYLACLKIGRTPTYEEAKTDDPVSYVLSLNLHRRHLTTSQKALVGVQAKEAFAAAAKERMLAGTKPDPMENLPQGDYGTARDRAGKALGISGKLIDLAEKVLKSGIPELVNAVDHGRMSVSAAAAIASKPRDQQLQAMDYHQRPREKSMVVVGDSMNGAAVVRVQASSAAHFTTMAISQLERIKQDDPQWPESFERVLAFINKRQLEWGASA